MQYSKLDVKCADGEWKSKRILTCSAQSMRNMHKWWVIALLEMLFNMMRNRSLVTLEQTAYGTYCFRGCEGRRTSIATHC